MPAFHYPAYIDRPGGDEILVSFPDFPEALTGANSIDEAYRLAEDALDEAVLSRLAAGEPVPAPGSVFGGRTSILIPLDPVTAARVAISEAMADRHMSKTALALLMHKDEKVVRRILDGRQNVAMDTAMEALHALGYRATLQIDARDEIEA